MSKNYNQISKEILEYVGGKENIISAAHCATRLRLVLKDDKKINIKAIEEMPAVKGNFNTSGQFQIILGSGVVNEVYKELIKIADIAEGSKEELKKEADKKLNPVQRLIKSLADVFVPVLPILVAAGLLMGINNILTSQGLFVEGQSLIEAHPQFKDLAEMINTFANTGFAFLPIFLGFSATKAFGGNPYLGACIGALMIHGDLLNGYSYPSAVIEGTVPYWNILGFSILKVGYQGTVLPVLASSFVLAKVEKTLHKIIPSVLDNLLTPLFTVFITGLLTFVAIGPVMRLAGDGITAGLIGLINTLGPIGGAIFGVNLKLRYPFYGAMIGSAVSSAYIMLTKVLALAPGAAGLPGIISIRPDSMINYIIGMAISMGVAVVSTIILAKTTAKKENLEVA